LVFKHPTGLSINITFASSASYKPVRKVAKIRNLEAFPFLKGTKAT